MKIICWNYHGLGTPREVRALQRLVRKISPHLIFLQDERLRNKEMEKIKTSLNFHGMLSVDCSGHLVILDQEV